jgi:putative transposase
MPKFEIPDGWVAQAYKFALDPTPAQVRAFRSHAGAAKKAHNTMLAAIKANLSQREAERSYGIAAQELTASLGWSLASLRREWNLRKETVAPWWPENSKEAYNTGLDALARALDAWAKSKKGTRAGRPVGFPRFKNRHDRRSVRFTTGTIRCEASRHHVTLPRLGAVRTHESTRKLARRVEQGSARILSATLSESGGRWHVSFQALVQRVPARPAHVKAGASVVGIDVGVKADGWIVAATPEGDEVLRVNAPKSLTAAQARLRALQRRAARQAGPWVPQTRSRREPSKRWRRTQRQVAKTHARAASLRRDALNKTTTTLAQTHDVIVVEHLATQAMRAKGGARKRGLNRSLADAALAEIRRLLTYKTAWYGSTLVVADRWFPSSKTCSACGRRKPNLTLAMRTFVCDTCGNTLDREVNAATNLARLSETNPRIGTRSGRAAHQRVGDERGATHKTNPAPAGKAAGREAYDPAPTPLDKTGTAYPQGQAA